MKHNAKYKRLKDRAIRLYETDKYRLGVTAFKKLLELDENDFDVKWYLAYCLLKIRHYKSSIKLWKLLAKIEPQHLNTHLNMACAFQDIGRNDLAIPNYKKELSINPFSREALYSLGTLYFNSRKYKYAINLLERCYGLNHCVHAMVTKLGWSYFKTGQIEKEMSLYEEWLKSHPLDTWALNNMGAALMQIQQYNRAQLFLQRAVAASKGEGKPVDGCVRRNLAKVKVLRAQAKQTEIKSESIMFA